MRDWLRATARPFYGKLAWAIALFGPAYRAVYNLVDFLGNVDFAWGKLGAISVDLSWLRVPEWPQVPDPSNWALLVVTALGFLAVCIVGVIETRRGRKVAQLVANAEQPKVPAARPIKHGVKATDTVIASVDARAIATSRTITSKREAKLSAMGLAGEVRAWADSWDARPAFISGDFEMMSEF